MATIIRLAGFSGHVIVNDIQLLSGNASFSTELSPSFITYADIKRDDTQRNKVLYADGTRVTTGSVSFDVMESDLLNLLTTTALFQRNYYFPVKIFDGFQGRQLSNCLVTSLSLSGSVGGLITASLSFTSNKDGESYDGSEGIFLNPKDTTPYGYWYSGSTSLQVSEWSLNYSQTVSPVHLNQIDDSNGTELPRYLKVQLQSTSLHLTTYDEIDPTINQVVVATKTFSIVGTVTAKGYNFTGTTSLGNFSHDFQSAAITAPNEIVLS